MSCVQIRCLRWLLSVPELRLRLCGGAYSTAEVVFCRERWFGFDLGVVFILNSANVEFRKERPGLYTEPL